ERAVTEHRAFFDHLRRGVRHEHALCHMDAFTDVAKRIVEVAAPAGKNRPIFLAVSGPRILLGGVFVAAEVLRDLTFKLNILVTRPLAYRSMRSTGESNKIHGWSLGQL